MSYQSTCVFIPIEVAPSRDFQKTVYESIDKTLSALGEQIKNCFYTALEKNYGIKRQEVGLKTTTFTAAIENLFGSSAKILEIKIIQNINRQVEGFTYRPKNGEFSFEDYLAALQKHMTRD